MGLWARPGGATHLRAVGVGAAVGVPGCECPQGQRRYFQAGQRTCEPLALDLLDSRLDIVDFSAQAGHAAALGVNHQLQVVAVRPLGLELVSRLVHLQAG